MFNLSYIFKKIFFSFKGLHLQHMAVPRLKANRSSSCWPTHSHSNTQIQASSVTYNTAHSNAGSLTHWARPGIEPTTSWSLVGFISAAPRRERLHFCSWKVILWLVISEQTVGFLTASIKNKTQDRKVLSLRLDAFLTSPAARVVEVTGLSLLSSAASHCGAELTSRINSLLVAQHPLSL